MLAGILTLTVLSIVLVCLVGYWSFSGTVESGEQLQSVARAAAEASDLFLSENIKYAADLQEVLAFLAKFEIKRDEVVANDALLPAGAVVRTLIGDVESPDPTVCRQVNQFRQTLRVLFHFTNPDLAHDSVPTDQDGLWRDLECEAEKCRRLRNLVHREGLTAA